MPSTSEELMTDTFVGVAPATMHAPHGSPHVHRRVNGWSSL